MTKKTDESNGKFAVGAALGVLVGAIAGVLFAPRSGKETRKIVGDKTKEYGDKGKDLAVKEIGVAKKAIEETALKIK